MSLFFIFKILRNRDHEQLEKEINNFLESLNIKTGDIKEIQYQSASVGGNSVDYSVMIIYYGEELDS